MPQISASPEPLLLGDVYHGQQVSKKVIVRGKKPFKIVSVEVPRGFVVPVQDRRQVERSALRRNRVRRRRANPGKVKQTIHITTDLGDDVQRHGNGLCHGVDEPPATTTANDSGAAAGQTNGGTATTASKQVAGP